jgi:two-component system, response regulator PdtaR
MTRSLRIAVADDEYDMRDYLQKVLEKLGHVVVGSVDNGLKLVELCRESTPDLVITDVCMPELNGPDALREIHAMYPVPCIVVSALDDPAQCGFASSPPAPWEFLGKPFRKHDLHDAIRRLMS